MRYAPLGRTRLQVSRLCLGTMNFGEAAEEAESHAILDRAVEAGINFVDTADVYGRKIGHPGLAEEIVGRWLAGDPGRRDGLVLATKVYGPTGPGPNDSGLSAYHIRAACEASLRRLQTDRIDLYQLHHIDRQAPWEEVWQALERLVREGKVIYVGSSNFPGWHLAAACETADRRGLLGPVSEQSPYSLLERTVELEVLPACRHYGVGLLPYSPLAQGLLAGVLRHGGGRRMERAENRAALERVRLQLEAFESLCDELGTPPGAVATAWLLSRPGVTAPVLGPRTEAHLAASLASLDVSMDEALARRLEEIFPARLGRPDRKSDEAPEAYAW